MTSLVLPYADTAMMNLFLAHLSRDFNEFFVLMLMDQVGLAISLEYHG